ncbi:Six-hairpin glycosidase-like protein [Aspergillus stella-maris]|uniref:Six-hairpin glycosidase-like protein n=1 Tax=Aspergillus stella-maris TaxID=1810926 RepID=UPI003CCCC4B8
MKMLSAVFLCAWLLPTLALGEIDRKTIVSKYNVIRIFLIDNETTPLQVGNGDFAFNVDNTGMQSFLPFNTLSSWGWHNDSLPTNGEQLSDYTGVPMLTHGRNVSYDIPDPDLPEVSQWLIGNPNRINLGRIGLWYKNVTLSAEQIANPRQELDLWNGTIISTFDVDGTNVRVITQGDFESDAVAFDIESELLQTGDLSVEFDFPYPPIHTTDYKYEVFVGVYDFPDNHTTTIIPSRENTTAHIFHELQEISYFVNLHWPSSTPLKLSQSRNATGLAKHRYTLKPRSPTSRISFTAHFSPEQSTPAAPSEIQVRNSVAWNKYWSTGGFIDLASSTNPSAPELQRRIILSMYHVRVNSAATGQSPQESGLMNNGWYGKFHMEMLIWHNAHWVTWGREEHFDAIFPLLYETLLPSSLERAKKMGWEGARWPKMTEIIMGVSSPGGINGLLLWQQPHPLYLAELSYSVSPTPSTLNKWDKTITATADYLASYAWYNQSSGQYDLGPPAYGVTENTPPEESRNLAYEIAYWRYALDTAITWKKRQNAPVPNSWITVSKHLSPPPIINDLYAVYADLNATWWNNPSLTDDPRSLIMLQGILPDNAAVDPVIAKATADKVDEIWDDEDIRGWGRPVLAINSARVGERDRAIGHLTAFERWVFDDAGFAERGGDGGTPPPFMPGNAGFLLAVAYMAAGWEGSEGHAPGFPNDGSWVVEYEGLRKAL